MSSKSLASLIFFLPIVSALFFVLHFGVDVPWGDQWDILPPLLETMQDDELDFSDLSAPHNEHLILFPRLIMLGLAYLTDWNTRTEMLVIMLMMLMILWILAAELRQSMGQEANWWPLVPLAFLIFNLKQWETMLFGIQIAYILPILATLLAFTLLKSVDKASGGMRMFLALICALIASFSMLAGLFVWPAALVILLLGGTVSRRFVPLWLLMGIATCGYYFYCLPTRSSFPPLSQLMVQPQDFFRFLLALLGHPILARESLVLIVGAGVAALILSCMAMLGVSRRFMVNRFRLGVLLYALFSLAAISMGRSSFGLDAAAAPRYTTFSLLALAALYAILFDLAHSKKETGLPRWAMALMLAIIVVSLPLSYHRGWLHGELLHKKQLHMAEVLRNVDRCSDEDLKLIHPRPDSVRTHVQVLKEMGYSVFSMEE